MIELDRRTLITGLAAIAAAGVAPAGPIRAASSATTAEASNIHRLFLSETQPAIRWTFSGIVSDPFISYSVKCLLPSSLWDFDPHLKHRPADQLFSIRHVASGITFRQVNLASAAIRLDYWDMTAVERPTWLDTTDVAILGEAAACVVAVLPPSRLPAFPFRVRFSPAPCSSLRKPLIAAVTAAEPLDHYDHVDD